MLRGGVARCGEVRSERGFRRRGGGAKLAANRPYLGNLLACVSNSCGSPLLPSSSWALATCLAQWPLRRPSSTRISTTTTRRRLIRSARCSGASAITAGRPSSPPAPMASVCFPPSPARVSVPRTRAVSCSGWTRLDFRRPMYSGRFIRAIRASPHCRQRWRARLARPDRLPPSLSSRRGSSTGSSRRRSSMTATASPIFSMPKRLRRFGPPSAPLAPRTRSYSA